MTKIAMSKVNKERVKNPLRNDAERYQKTAGMILNAMHDYPSDKDGVEYLVNDTLIYEADIVDGEVIHIDHAPFDPVFDRMVADGQIVKMPDGRYSRSGVAEAEPKLPDYVFPRRIFGKDKLRDALRIWLLDWFKSNSYEPDGSLWVWQECSDRDIRLLDARRRCAGSGR
jgi:hypothetical protein